MAASMDVDRTPLDHPVVLHELPQAQEPSIPHTTPLSNGTRGFPFLPSIWPTETHTLLVDPLRHPGAAQPREPFREIPVKVHIRRPDRDAWVYVGRATVSLDITSTGHASQVGEPPLSTPPPRENPDQSSAVVRSSSADKILTVFSEVSQSFDRRCPLTYRKHRAANFRLKSVATLSLLDASTAPRSSRGR